MVVTRSELQLHPIVEMVSTLIGVEPIHLMLGAGADFSLVGTIRGKWSSEAATDAFGHAIQIIGHVEQGEGVWFHDGQRLQPQG